jgi:hypothetical protein
MSSPGNRREPYLTDGCRYAGRDLRVPSAVTMTCGDALLAFRSLSTVHFAVDVVCLRPASFSGTTADARACRSVPPSLACVTPN